MLKDILPAGKTRPEVLSAARAKYPELAGLDDDLLSSTLISSEPELAPYLTPASTPERAPVATPQQKDPFRNARNKYGIPEGLPDDIAAEILGMPVKPGVPGIPGVQPKPADPGSDKTGFLSSAAAGTMRTAAGVSRVPEFIVKAATTPGVVLGMPVLAWRSMFPEGAQMVDNWVESRPAENPVANYLEAAAQSKSFVKRNWSDKGENFRSIVDRGDKLEIANYIAHQVVENAPQQIALLAAAAAGAGPAALAGMGLTTAAQTWAESAKTSKAGPDARFHNAVVNGALEAGFEHIGTFGLFKRWEAALAAKFAKGEVRQILAAVGKTIASSVLGEGAEEAGTELGQNLSSYVFGVDPSALDGLGMKIVEAGVVGAASGGLFTAPGSIASGASKAFGPEQAAQVKPSTAAPIAEPNFAGLRSVAPAIQDYVKRAFPELIPALGTEDLPVRPAQLEAEIMKASMRVDEAVKAGMDPAAAKATAIEAMVDSLHRKSVGLRLVDAPQSSNGPTPVPDTSLPEDFNPFLNPEYEAEQPSNPAPQEGDAPLNPAQAAALRQGEAIAPPPGSSPATISKRLKSNPAQSGGVAQPKPVKLDRFGIPKRAPGAIVATVNLEDGGVKKITHKQVMDEAAALYTQAKQEYQDAGPDPLAEFVISSGGIRSFRKGAEMEEHLAIPLRFRRTTGRALDEMADEAYTQGLLPEPSAELLRDRLANMRGKGKPPRRAEFYDIAIRNLEEYAIDPERYSLGEAKAKYRAESLYSDPPIASERKSASQRYQRIRRAISDAGYEIAGNGGDWNWSGAGSSYFMVENPGSGERLKIRVSDHAFPPGGGYRVNDQGDNISSEPDVSIHPGSGVTLANIVRKIEEKFRAEDPEFKAPKPKVTKAERDASEYRDLQTQAKSAGLPATGSAEYLSGLLDVIKKGPRSWSRDEFMKIAPHLMIHQDLKEGAADRILAITRDGLSGGMVDSLGNMSEGRWTWSGGLQGAPSYVFIAGALKYKSETDPHLAPGNRPLFAFWPNKGEDIHEAIKRSASIIGQLEAPAGSVKQTETPEFKAWFGESKVVDSAGVPRIVYHGTNQNITRFLKSRLGKNTGAHAAKAFFFTENPDEAGEYAAMSARHQVSDAPRRERNARRLLAELDRAIARRDFEAEDRLNRELEENEREKFSREDVGANIMPVYLSVKNPMVLDMEDSVDLQRIASAIKEAKEKGHDGLRLDNVFDVVGSRPSAFSTTQWVVFDSRQVKSATGNRGTFNPKDPNILRQEVATFYSAVEKTLEEKMPAKAPAQQILGLLRNTPGVKQEEIETLGLEEFLSGQAGAIDKKSVLDFVKQGGVKVEEVVKGKRRDRSFSIDSEARFQAERMGDVWDDLPPSRQEAYREMARDLPNRDENASPLGVIDDTKFSRYTLPGGENYRELLFKLPAEEVLPHERGSATRISNDFRSSHFSEPNILAHVRFNERTDTEGKRVLFIEEVQSDWHQKGREKGYRNDDVGPEPEKVTATSVIEKEHSFEVHFSNGDVREVGKGTLNGYHAGGDRFLKADEAGARAYYKDSIDRLNNDRRGAWLEKKIRRVPDAPFKKTWHELVLKRMLRWAAENGFDRIAWTTGEQQAERYDLSQHFDTVRIHKIEAPADKAGWHVEARGKDRLDHIAKTDQELAETVGKELAEKAINQINQQIEADKGETPEQRAADSNDAYEAEYSGLDLKVGGEGMKGFYDQIIPSFLNKYTKKWGGRVQDTYIDLPERLATPNVNGQGIVGESDDEGSPSQRSKVHALDITPAMRDAVIRVGQALFEPSRVWQPRPSPSVARQLSFDVVFNPTRTEEEHAIPPVPDPGSGYKIRLSSGRELDLSDAPFEIKLREIGKLIIPAAKISSPADIAVTFRYLTNPLRENFVIGAVRDGRLVAVEHVGIGTIDQVAAYPRALVGLLNATGATEFVLVHNHPSGHVDPSKEDMELTRRMKSIGAKLGAKMIGHVVINNTKFGFISPNGSVGQYEHKAYARTREIPRLETYVESKPGADYNRGVGRKKLTSPASVFELYKAIQLGQDGAMVAFLNTQNEVVASRIVPRADVTEEFLLRAAYAYGASGIATVNTGIPTTEIRRIKSVLENADIRWLDDVSPVDSGSLYRSQAAAGFMERGLPYKAGESPRLREAGAPIDPQGEQELYNYARTYKGLSGKDTTREFIESRKALTKEMWDRIGVVFTSRLSAISPKLKGAVRRFEFTYREAIKRDIERLRPMLDALDRIRKESPEDYRVMDLALKNGASHIYTEIGAKYGMNFQNFYAWSDEIRRRIQAAGYEVGYLPGYWPRMIRNRKGFIKFMEKQAGVGGDIQAAIRDKENELGRDLNDDEKANLINSFIRGFVRSKVALGRTGNMKTREIEALTPEAAEFYYSSREALVRYVIAVNEAVEARKFFGRAEVKPDLDTAATAELAKMSEQEKKESTLSFANIQDSIGAFVNRLLERNEISPRQQEELRDLFQARFGYLGTHGLLGLFKNVMYMDTIANPISAISQLEDLGVAVYRAAWQTPGSFIRAVADRSKIKIDDLGLDVLNAEVTEGTKSAAALRVLLRASGFEFMDRIGKETYVNAVIDKYRADLQRGNIDAEKRIIELFGSQADTVIDELKAGVTSENVLFLAFNELSEIQPITLSEVPEAYLQSPGSRLFYALKTFMVRRLDFILNEVRRGKSTPEKIHNFLRLYAVLIVFGAGVDELKDFILGRKTAWSDRLIDNLVKPFGVSKFFLYQVRDEGVVVAAGKFVTPPARLLWAAQKDLRTGGRPIKRADGVVEAQALEMPASIPIGGKLWYWWFGRGRQKERMKAARAEKRKLQGWSADEISKGAREKKDGFFGWQKETPING